MKNTIITASFLLLSTLTYGQTKEETISWLKEKFDKYSYGTSNLTLKQIFVNECEITLFQKGGGYNHIVVKIPLEEVKLESYGFFVDGIEYTISEGINSNYGTSTTYTNNWRGIAINLSEKDLISRMNSAINHLQTFCTKKKKKETF